ncbi:MAG: hypothetical protein AB1483_04615 [Candidatus Zixiibacteriota bacterium]
MPTARNARGIDLVAYDSTGSNYVGVQVKSLSRRMDVPLGNSVEKIMGDFWVVLYNVHDEPSAFVLTAQEVRSNAVHNEKDGQVSWWLSAKFYDSDEYCEAWDRIIGSGDNKVD